jgi:hypothetical protein
MTITNAGWKRKDLVALADEALATFGDVPAVAQAAQAARRKALDDRAWLALGDPARNVVKDDLEDRMSDAALDRLLVDLEAQGLFDVDVQFVDDDGGDL